MISPERRELRKHTSEATQIILYRYYKGCPPVQSMLNCRHEWKMLFSTGMMGNVMDVVEADTQ